MNTIQYENEIKANIKLIAKIKKSVSVLIKILKT